MFEFKLSSFLFTPLTCPVAGVIARLAMKGNSLFVVKPFKNPSGIIFLGLLLMSAQSSFADTVNVPLPQPDVYQNNPPAVSVTTPLPELLDISLSSWYPSAMNSPSQVAAISSFASSFPAISASYLDPVIQSRTGDLYLRIGGEFRESSRSAPLLPAENLYLISLRLGAEWKPAKPRHRIFTPYVGFSLLPTWASASVSNSAYDNGISVFDIPVEFDLGTEINMGSSPSSLKLTVAAQLFVGRVLGSNLLGGGVIGGVRIPL